MEVTQLKIEVGFDSEPRPEVSVSLMIVVTRRAACNAFGDSSLRIPWSRFTYTRHPTFACSATQAWFDTHSTHLDTTPQ
jgi:hypothetical protein